MNAIDGKRFSDHLELPIICFSGQVQSGADSRHCIIITHRIHSDPVSSTGPCRYQQWSYGRLSGPDWSFQSGCGECSLAVVTCLFCPPWNSMLQCIIKWIRYDNLPTKTDCLISFFIYFAISFYKSCLILIDLGEWPFKSMGKRGAFNGPFSDSHLNCLSSPLFII